MKFRVPLRDKDELQEAITSAVETEVTSMPLSDEERELIIDRRVDETEKLCATWFNEGEVFLEIDTALGTCSVVRWTDDTPEITINVGNEFEPKFECTKVGRCEGAPCREGNETCHGLRISKKRFKNN